MAPNASMPYRFAEKMMSFFFKKSMDAETALLFPLLMACSSRQKYWINHNILGKKYKVPEAWLKKYLALPKGILNTDREAYQGVIKTYEPGRFMIQEVHANPEDDIVWYSPFTYVRVF
jgi:hypothetical protein